MLMLRPLLRYADFRGRARRAEYWLFVLVQGVVMGLFLAMAFGSLGADTAQGALGGFMLWMGLMGIAGLAFFIPNLAVLVRRLHDTGRSGWWMMLQAPGWFAPMMMGGALVGAGAQVGTATDPQAATAAVLGALAGGSLIMMVASLCSLILFVFTLLPGTSGPNRFGPDPKDPEGRVSTDDAGGSSIDEARLDELFAQAKKERDGPYKPVFDFSPGAPDPQPFAPRTMSTPAADASAFGQSAYDLNAPRTFGRRGA